MNGETVSVNRKQLLQILMKVEDALKEVGELKKEIQGG